MCHRQRGGQRRMRPPQQRRRPTRPELVRVEGQLRDGHGGGPLHLHPRRGGEAGQRRTDRQQRPQRGRRHPRAQVGDRPGGAVEPDMRPAHRELERHRHRSPGGGLDLLPGGQGPQRAVQRDRLPAPASGQRHRQGRRRLGRPQRQAVHRQPRRTPRKRQAAGVERPGAQVEAGEARLPRPPPPPPPPWAPRPRAAPAARGPPPAAAPRAGTARPARPTAPRAPRRRAHSRAAAPDRRPCR